MSVVVKAIFINTPGIGTGGQQRIGKCVFALSGNFVTKKARNKYGIDKKFHFHNALHFLDKNVFLYSSQHPKAL